MKLAVALVTLCIAAGACAQQPAAPAAAKKTCTIEPAHDPTEADKALADGHFAQAEKLFAAMPASDAQFTGQVRAIMAQNRLKEALTLATAANAAHPDDAVLVDLLGEVRFRRGEVDAAAETINRSVNLDFCHARTHYDMSRYLILNGLYASGQQQLEIAHKLAPHDPLIDNIWQRSHYTPPPARAEHQHLEGSKSKQASTGSDDAEGRSRQSRDQVPGDAPERATASWSRTCRKHQGWHVADGECQREATLQVLGEELEVYFNGKRRRMVLDTGASGIVLSQSAVKALGPDRGATNPAATASVTRALRQGLPVAHVDSIRIGQHGVPQLHR